MWPHIANTAEKSTGLRAHMAQCARDFVLDKDPATYITADLHQCTASSSELKRVQESGKNWKTCALIVHILPDCLTLLWYYHTVYSWMRLSSTRVMEQRSARHLLSIHTSRYILPAYQTWYWLIMHFKYSLIIARVCCNSVIVCTVISM